MKNLISVVIPVYNVEKYLNKCVDSVLQQTYSEIEIILVDDGSTDKSGKICDNYIKKDSRIKVIHKENGGLSSARNAGIENAIGEFICFIDSDDFIELEMLEKLVKSMLDYNADMAICNRNHLFENGKKYVKFDMLNQIKEMNNLEALFELNNFKYFDISACGRLYKKSLFSNIKFPVGKLCEDYYVMYRIIEMCNKILYISQPLYNYFQRKGSITKVPKLNYDFVNAAYEQMIYLSDKYPELEECTHVAYASANMTIYNTVIKENGKCMKKDVKKLRDEVKKNYIYVKNSKQLSKIKKIQSYLFIKCIAIYNLSFKLYNKIKN